MTQIPVVTARQLRVVRTKHFNVACSSLSRKRATGKHQQQVDCEEYTGNSRPHHFRVERAHWRSITNKKKKDLCCPEVRIDFLFHKWCDTNWMFSQHLLDSRKPLPWVKEEVNTPAQNLAEAKQQGETPNTSMSLAYVGQTWCTMEESIHNTINLHTQNPKWLTKERPHCWGSGPQSSNKTIAREQMCGKTSWGMSRIWQLQSTYHIFWDVELLSVQPMSTAFEEVEHGLCRKMRRKAM